jgi:hypothetical protein
VERIDKSKKKEEICKPAWKSIPFITLKLPIQAPSIPPRHLSMLGSKIKMASYGKRSIAIEAEQGKWT